jgi:two-component sensor histidine kinase
MLKAPEREGFGSALLRKVLPLQTKAEVQVSFDGFGLQCRIEVPLVEKRFVPEY